MTPQALAPTLLLPLLAFSVYRRVRRNIGRQPLAATRLKVRIGFLALAAVLIVANVAHTAELQMWMAAGAAPGFALALWGVKLAHIEWTPQGIFYTPNPYIGIAVSLLLIGRIAYRFVQIGPAMQSPQAMTMYTSTPLTMGLLGVVFGYYVAYCAGLLWRSRHLPAVAA